MTKKTSAAIPVKMFPSEKDFHLFLYSSISIHLFLFGGKERDASCEQSRRQCRIRESNTHGWTWKQTKIAILKEGIGECDPVKSVLFPWWSRQPVCVEQNPPLRQLCPKPCPHSGCTTQLSHAHLAPKLKPRKTLPTNMSWAQGMSWELGVVTGTWEQWKRKPLGGMRGWGGKGEGKEKRGRHVYPTIKRAHHRPS